MEKSLKKGFTLIELLVVIAIIGILSSVVLVSLNNARAKARDAGRKSNAQQITTALSLFSDAFNSSVSVATITGCPAGWTTVAGPPVVGCPTSADLIPTYMSRFPDDVSNVYAYTNSGTQFCMGASLEAPTGTDKSFQCGSSGCDATSTGPTIFSTDPWTSALCLNS